MEKDRRKQSMMLLGVMLAFLIILIIYLLLVRPSSQQVSDQEHEITRLENTTKILQRTIQKNQQKKELSPDIQAALPLWDNTEQLVLDLKEIGIKSHANLESAAFQSNAESEEKENSLRTESANDQTNSTDHSTETKSVARELTVHVFLKGSYPQLLSWVDFLQKLPRLIVVDSIRYTNGGARSSVEITFKAFFDPTYKDMIEDPILPLTSH